MAENEGWVEGLPIAITVTDADGVILAMNARSRETFAADGGGALVGTSVFACHPEPSLTKIRQLYAGRAPSHYTIRKHGQRKVIHQVPWEKDGTFAGYVELAIVIPDELPHFDRD